MLGLSFQSHVRGGWMVRQQQCQRRQLLVIVVEEQPPVLAQQAYALLCLVQSRKVVVVLQAPATTWGYQTKRYFPKKWWDCRARSRAALRSYAGTTAAKLYFVQQITFNGCCARQGRQSQALLVNIVKLTITLSAQHTCWRVPRSRPAEESVAAQQGSQILLKLS